MRKYARFAHVHLVGKQAYGQAFEAVAACQAKGYIQDRCAGQFALAHEFRCRVSHDGTQ
jgi:hypothetical protein